MIFGDIFYLVLEILFGGLSLAIAIIASKYASSKYKMIYLVAPVLTVGFIALTGFDKVFIPAYIVSALLILGFFFEKKVLRMILSILLMVTMIGEYVEYNDSPLYREPDYVAEFKHAYELMEEHYVLTEHKDIDFDALYDKYLPQIKDAAKRHDKADVYIAWLSFCSEFKDGHVSFMPNITEDEFDVVTERLYGYDYGFSLMRKSDDTIVAVNVETGSAAEAAGIKNGTAIVEWNGQPVEDMIAAFDAPLYNNIPVKESEDFLRVIFASGQSGDGLKVSFVNDDGAIAEIDLEKIGTYADRLEDTLSKVLDGKLETNLSVSQINSSTAFIRIDSMGYDSNSYGSNNYDAMYSELRDALQLQKDAGVTDLIIDLRANTGGDPGFDKTVFRLLFPEGEYTMSYNSVWDVENSCYMIDETTGGYVLGTPNKFYGEGFWGNGKIIVLVSATTVSAGDMFTEVISRLDNVTIMGITPSNCACQAVRGVSDMEFGMLSFSAVPDLNADGSIYIDTDVTREATVPLDIQIEVDDEFIDAIFNRGEDYVLDKAVEYIGL